MILLASLGFTFFARMGMILLLALGSIQAQEAPSSTPASIGLVRLIGGGGQATEDHVRSGCREWGAEVLLAANDRQRYGLRISSLDIDVSGQRQRYLCTGVMLEMVAWECLRMEVGTVGFVGRDERSGKNPFGLASFLGYEKRFGRLNLSVGYDSKMIFTRPAITVGSLGVGVGVHF